MAILLVLVVPRLVEATNTQPPNKLYEQLRTLRTAIAVYRSQHGNTPPGFPGGDRSAQPTYEVLVTQLTQYSDELGNTSPVPGEMFPLGPYLDAVPKNVINQQAGIRLIPIQNSLPPAPVGTEGWLYEPATGTLVANTLGVDPAGQPYFNY